MRSRTAELSTGARAIVDELVDFFESSQNPVLFAGAGVSARAGLPTWKGLVERLAEGIRAYDALTRDQMLYCANDGDYTRAVDYFNMSTKMLEGDKRKLFVRLLSDYDASAIHTVAQLPCKAYLTTNFDRSIFDAVAATRKLSPLDFRLGDASFKEAVWAQNLFVARIHGAVEAPTSMVLSGRQFDSLKDDGAYGDLLRACFLNRNVLFLGFSFYDPAIRGVLDEVDKKIGPASSGRHLALIPSDAAPEFLIKANRLNIRVAKYDNANNHQALWDALDAFIKKRSSGTPKSDPPGPPAPFSAAKRYLAACYARAQTADSATALRGAVTEGVIAALLQEAAPSALSRSELLERVRVILGIRGQPAEVLVDGAVQGLLNDGLCRKHRSTEKKGTKYAWIDTRETSISMSAALQKLTKSTLHRAYLQEGWTIPEDRVAKLESLFSYMAARRGWDLGAAFASGKAPESLSIESFVRDAGLSLPAFDLERLVRVLVSMFQNPTEEEAQILGELGRISFAVELAFQAPGSVLLHKAVLPSRLYFDASVLLPAIVDGHPLFKLYSDAVRRLREAAASAVTPLHLKVCKVYLNEIISHRRNAEDYCKAVGSNFIEISQSDAMFHGAANVNVFVGAFANWVYINGPITFNEYLAKIAPYKTESELRRWLEKKGFEVVEAIKGTRYSPIYSHLERKNAERLARGKNPILIQHDAIQLSILDSEVGRFERAIFVTADRNLQEAVAELPDVSHLTEVMISHVGLVQLIQLLLGGVREGSGLVELLWSAKISDQALAVHSYLVARALGQYDDGIAMTIAGVVESCAEQADAELKRSSADLESEEPTKRARAFKKLGALEKTYMQGMREAAERLRGDRK